MSFRLLTVNLRNGRVDPDALAQVLDGTRPDLVATQELGPEAARVIAARYRHHDLHPDLEYLGRGIASNFDAEFGTLELPWRSGSWARVKVEGHTVVLIDIHMLNPVDFPWWVSVGRRADQLQGLFSWAGRHVSDEPVVVAGDMNASPRWPLYRRLAQRWADLVAKHCAETGVDPDPTWAPSSLGPRLLRIDHVFGSGIRAVSASVERVKGSDHSAVIVDLELD